MNVGEGLHTRPEQQDEIRDWDDCVRYGFMAMGNGEDWINKARKPAAGEYLFAYLNEFGYVGYAIIVEAAVPFKEFVPTGESKSLVHLTLEATATPERMQNPRNWDMCIRVRWIKTLERNHGVKGIWNYTGTLCELTKVSTVTALLEKFDPAQENVSSHK